MSATMDALFGEVFAGSWWVGLFGLVMLAGALASLMFLARQSIGRIIRRFRRRRPVASAPIPRRPVERFVPPVPPWVVPLEPVTAVIPRYTDHPDATAVLPRIPREVRR